MGSAKKIRVIKRNGEEVAFHLSKIENAIAAANKEVDRLHQMNDYQIKAVAENVSNNRFRGHDSCGPCRGYPGYGGDRLSWRCADTK